jgi:hypothetical protein
LIGRTEETNEKSVRFVGVLAKIHVTPKRKSEALWHETAFSVFLYRICGILLLGLCQCHWKELWMQDEKGLGIISHLNKQFTLSVALWPCCLNKH